MLPELRKSGALHFWKVPRLHQFALLVRVTYKWRWARNTGEWLNELQIRLQPHRKHTPPLLQTPVNIAYGGKGGCFLQ